MSYPHVQQKSGFLFLPERGVQAADDYVTLVDKNGLIQVLPRRKVRSHTPSFTSVKLLFLFVVLVTLFKALALLNVGLVDYESELTALQSGNVFEQAGAFVLQVDPLTSSIYTGVKPFLY